MKELLDGWEIRKLMDISIDKGQYGSGASAIDYDDALPRYIRITDIENDGTLKDTGLKSPSEIENKYFLQKGDILFARSGSVGRTYVHDLDNGNYQYAGYLIRFKLNSEIMIPKYLSYYCKSKQYWAWIDTQSKSVTITNINAKQYAKLPIPLPPLPTQHRIVAILEKAEQVKNWHSEQSQLLDDYLKSVFLEMFGDPGTNLKGWKEIKVIEKAKCIVPGRDKPKSFTGDIPWITTDDLAQLGTTQYSSNNIGLNKKEIEQVRARVIPNKSVLMTCVGDLGTVSIAGRDMVVNQQLHSFQCDSELNNIFLMFNLFFQKSYMIKMATSTTVLYLNKTACNNIPIILPPIALQSKFASIVQHTEKLKAQHMESAKQADDLFNALMQKAFTGELVA